MDNRTNNAASNQARATASPTLSEGPAQVLPQPETPTSATGLIPPPLSASASLPDNTASAGTPSTPDNVQAGVVHNGRGEGVTSAHGHGRGQQQDREEKDLTVKGEGSDSGVVASENHDAEAMRKPPSFIREHKEEPPILVARLAGAQSLIRLVPTPAPHRTQQPRGSGTLQCPKCKKWLAATNGLTGHFEIVHDMDNTSARQLASSVGHSRLPAARVPAVGQPVPTASQSTPAAQAAQNGHATDEAPRYYIGNSRWGNLDFHQGSRPISLEASATAERIRSLKQELPKSKKKGKDKDGPDQGGDASDQEDNSTDHENGSDRTEDSPGPKKRKGKRKRKEINHGLPNRRTIKKHLADDVRGGDGILKMSSSLRQHAGDLRLLTRNKWALVLIGGPPRYLETSSFDRGQFRAQTERYTDAQSQRALRLSILDAEGVFDFGRVLPHPPLQDTQPPVQPRRGPAGQQHVQPSGTSEFVGMQLHASSHGPTGYERWNTAPIGQAGLYPGIQSPLSRNVLQLAPHGSARGPSGGFVSIQPVTSQPLQGSPFATGNALSAMLSPSWVAGVIENADRLRASQGYTQYHSQLLSAGQDTFTASSSGSKGKKRKFGDAVALGPAMPSVSQPTESARLQAREIIRTPAETARIQAEARKRLRDFRARLNVLVLNTDRRDSVFNGRFATVGGLLETINNGMRSDRALTEAVLQAMLQMLSEEGDVIRLQGGSVELVEREE